MTKSELVVSMVQKSELKKKDVEAALNSLLEVIKESLVKGEPVNMVGFGKFEAVQKKERTGHNPNTMEKITIAAKRVPKFKFSPLVKQAVK